MENDSSICPKCGHALQGGTCRNCGKNDFNKEKKWRTGDRGGVRLERHTRDLSPPPLPPGLQKSSSSEPDKVVPGSDQSPSAFTNLPSALDGE